MGGRRAAQWFQIRLLFLALLFLLGGSGAALPRPAAADGQPLPTSARQLLRAYVTELLDFHRVPSLALGVTKVGGPRWAMGDGIVNCATGAQATSQTVYPIASLIKPMVALGVLAAAHGRSLAPDKESIGGHLPARVLELLSADKAIALDRLLAHAVIVGPAEGASLTHIDGRDPWSYPTYPTFEELVCRCRLAPTLPLEAVYSNDSYLLAGHVLCSLSADNGHKGPFTYTDLNAALHRWVWDPIGMPLTGSFPTPAMLERLCILYRWNGVQFEPRPPVRRLATSSLEAYSCVEDVLELLEANLGGGSATAARVLPAEVIKFARSPYFAPGTKSEQGHGWRPFLQDGRECFIRDGYLQDQLGLVVADVTNSCAACLLTNSNGTGVEDLFDALSRLANVAIDLARDAADDRLAAWPAAFPTRRGDVEFEEVGGDRIATARHRERNWVLDVPGQQGRGGERLLVNSGPSPNEYLTRSGARAVTRRILLDVGPDQTLRGLSLEGDDDQLREWRLRPEPMWPGHDKVESYEGVWLGRVLPPGVPPARKVESAYRLSEPPLQEGGEEERVELDIDPKSRHRVFLLSLPGRFFAGERVDRVRVQLQPGSLELVVNLALSSGVQPVPGGTEVRLRLRRSDVGGKRILSGTWAQGSQERGLELFREDRQEAVLPTGDWKGALMLPCGSRPVRLRSRGVRDLTIEALDDDGFRPSRVFVRTLRGKLKELEARGGALDGLRVTARIDGHVLEGVTSGPFAPGALLRVQRAVDTPGGR